MASNEPVRVEQCDQEAATAYYASKGIARLCGAGKNDIYAKAFAWLRHRILSQADGQREVVMQLAEAAAALNVATDGMQTLRPQRKDVLDALNALGEFYKEQNNG